LPTVTQRRIHASSMKGMSSHFPVNVYAWEEYSSCFTETTESNCGIKSMWGKIHQLHVVGYVQYCTAILQNTRCYSYL